MKNQNIFIPSRLIFKEKPSGDWKKDTENLSKLQAEIEKTNSNADELRGKIENSNSAQKEKELYDQISAAIDKIKSADRIIEKCENDIRSEYTGFRLKEIARKNKKIALKEKEEAEGKKGEAEEELKKLQDSDEYRNEVIRLEKEKDKLIEERERLSQKELVLLDEIKNKISAISDKNVLVKIVKDETLPYKVRSFALRNPEMPVPVLEQYVRTLDSAFYSSILANPSTPEKILREYSEKRHDTINMFKALAENPKTPGDILEMIAQNYIRVPRNPFITDPVFSALVRNPSSTPEVFEMIRPQIDYYGTEEDKRLMRAHPNYKSE